jgi:two-component system NtrC family sensor kinase
MAGKGSLPISPAQGKSPGVVRWLKLSIVAAALLPTAFFAAAAWISYRQTLSEAATRIERASRVAQEHAMRVIETNEVIARNILHVLGSASSAEIRGREGQLHAYFANVAGNLSQIQSVWVWDESGRPLVSNRFYPVPRDFNVSDREFFSWHKSSGDRSYYVTQPMVAKLTGETFFDVAYRRLNADKSFAGIVSVSLYPSHFSNFYQKLAIEEPGLVLSLFRDDGTVLATYPDTQSAETKLAPSSRMMQAIQGGGVEGYLSTADSTEGKAHAASFRKVDRYPLFVSAAMSRDLMLSGWHRNVAILAAFTFPLALVLMFVAWVALRRTQRELSAVRALREESVQRTRAEQALLQSQKLEALGRLTGGVAHDFNNLLMVINNNAYLMKRHQRSGDNSGQIGAIERAVEAGTKLTRQLLAFSRRQAVHPEVMRLQNELPSLIDLMKPALGSRVTVKIHADENAAPVHVDRAELELSMLNLAVNASDAMPDGGEVVVELRNARPGEVPNVDGDLVLVSISDTGNGIPRDVQQRVFEPFFTTKPVGKGTGLGLSQVYGFCQQSGGTATIESKEGVGTTVRLYLGASAEQMKDESAGPKTAAPTELCHRILIVEDNDEVADATQQLLQFLGCTVKRAESGNAAVVRLERSAKDFDLVLTDIVMPGGLSGIEVLHYVRDRFPQLPVVLMTGYSSELQKLGPEEIVLLKPFSPQELAEAVRKALARHEEGASLPG